MADGIRGLNVLGLILFCFVFGGILAQMGICLILIYNEYSINIFNECSYGKGKEAEILIKVT